MKKFFRTMSLVGLLMFCLCLPALAASGPMEQVSRTVDAVIETLENEQITGQEERRRLAELIKARFDFETMSRWVLGPYWRRADQAEQQRFIELFSELLKATYLDRIQAYTDEKVKYAEENVDENRAEVRTFVLSGNKEIPITYRVTLQADEWMVFDVIVENVSLVRNYRSTFSEIVRKDGMQALFAQMQEKIRDLEGSSDKE